MSIFGSLFRVSTFGESHGVGVGCIVDGLPAGVPVSEEAIQKQMSRRRPGQSSITTSRSEQDLVTILSGTENGISLGTPIAVLVKNQDQRKYDYANTITIPRPGHADYTYQTKYGIKASSGGGRASARETIGRVAAGAIAELWLQKEFNTKIVAFVSSVGDIKIPDDAYGEILKNITREEVDSKGRLRVLEDERFVDCNQHIYSKDTGEDTGKLFNGESVIEELVVRCPHPPTAVKIARLILQTRTEGDTVGGVCSCVATSVPVGIGEPCFDKLEAELAKGMLSLPATKGFEIGTGFEGTKMKGSQHNDSFVGAVEKNNQKLLYTKTNNAGGTLGGISTGNPLVFRVAVKPVSSINKEQETCTFDGVMDVLAVKGRHDPCVLPRIPSLIESMAALVIADSSLKQRARIATPLLTLDN